MTKSSLSITASESMIPDLLEAAGAVPDVAASKPILAESVPSSYRAPFGMSIDELQALLKVVMIVIQSATALVAFADKIIEVVRKHRQPLVLAAPRNPKEQLQVDTATTREVIMDWIKRVL